MTTVNDSSVKIIFKGEDSPLQLLGAFESEKSACVAMTGCPGEDVVEITVLSSHNAGYHMYRWLKDGSIEAIEDHSQVRSLVFCIF